MIEVLCSILTLEDLQSGNIVGNLDPTPGNVEGLLAAGLAASLEGNWASAKTSFQAVVDLEESGEALAGLGNAQWWLGETEASIESAQRAYAAFRRRPDPVQAVLAAIALYFAYRISLGNRAAARGWQSRAARLVEEFALAPLEGWILLVRAHDSDAAEAEKLTTAAADLARQFSDADLELCALSQRGASLMEMGRIAEGIALLDEAMAAALGGEGTTPNTVVYTSCNVITSCSQAAEVERAVQWIRAADQFTRRYGCPHLYTLCRAFYGRLLFLTGDWGRAEKELRAALEIGRTAERALYGEAVASLAELRMAQGKFSEARALLAGFEDHSSAARALAAFHLAQGEPGVAAALVRRRLRQDSADEQVVTPYVAGESIPLEQATLLELLCEAEVRLGNGAAAIPIAQQMIEMGEELDYVAAVARGTRALGRALAVNSDGVAAVPLFEKSLQLFVRLGLPLDAGRSRLLLAMKLEQSERDMAIAEGRVALSLFEELGAGPDADAAAAFLRSIGAKAARLGPRGLGTLTKREIEVLDLLGEGVTNRQIAARLFLSPKTVEHHVRSVLAKLELSNRTEAAAYAVRNAGATSGSN